MTLLVLILLNRKYILTGRILLLLMKNLSLKGSSQKNPSSSPKINNSFKKKLVLLGSFRKNSFSFRETEGSFEKNLSLKGSSQKNPSSFSKIKNSFQKKLVLVSSFRKNSFSFCETESSFEKNLSLKESSH